MSTQKKTSDKWQKECDTLVLDPDGWDRHNYQYSWYEEKITRQEFENRLILSTCVFKGWKSPSLNI